MRYAVLIIALPLLAGCAHDTYTATTGDPVYLKTTLSDCKRQAIHTYAYGQSPIGALLGPVVGMAAGAGDASKINPEIESCMLSKGYVGYSEN